MPPHTPRRMRGMRDRLAVAVRDLAGRDFLERDRQVVLRRGVHHRGRKLLERPLAEIVVVGIDLAGTLSGNDHAGVRGINMLEQAVYARRNHTAILAGVFSLLLCGSAQAADVLRLGLRSTLRQVVTGPDGGAWAGVYSYEHSRIIRVMPEGALRPTPVEFLGGDGGLGPDG